MKIYFIKHGRTIEYSDSNSKDVNETSIQKEDYMLLHSYRAPDVDVVYSSPSSACIDTAKEMFTGNYVEVIDNLSFRNNDINILKRKETFNLFKKRCVECFDIIMWDAIQKDTESIAIVVHEDIAKAILDEYSMPHLDYDKWEMKYLSGYEGEINSIFWHSNKCICNILKYNGER